MEDQRAALQNLGAPNLQQVISRIVPNGADSGVPSMSSLTPQADATMAVPSTTQTRRRAMSQGARPVSLPPTVGSHRSVLELPLVKKLNLKARATPRTPPVGDEEVEAPAKAQKTDGDNEGASRAHVFTEAEQRILAMAKDISEKAVVLDAERRQLNEQQASSTMQWQQIQERGQADQAALENSLHSLNQQKVQA